MVWNASAPRHVGQIVSEDTIVHSQMPGFIQGIARMTSKNEAFRLNLLGRAGRSREVEPMAQWPAPDPQAWQPPAPASPPPQL